MDAVTIYEGPAHVIVWMNPAMLALTGIDPIGMPAREVFPGYPETQALMDAVYWSGVGAHRCDQTPSGVVGTTFIERRLSGDGVVTLWRPLPVASVLSLPELVAR